MRHFTVIAARQTGEWYRESLTETDQVDETEFNSRIDTNDVHYDRFEHGAYPNDETCAITVTFENDGE
jgi:hypothetical protein